MEMQAAPVGYAVPTYEAPEGAAWYHFLHGNVPGHQIDFMYRPEVPQGSLTRQHFSHLARLVRYIEPRAGSTYAFAIGNLSRDDTQYEPGHGGVALIFGLRIRGAKDHAGRQDPPFSHAAAAIARHLDEAALFEAALAFYHKLLPDEESRAEGSGWYHTYVQHAQNPDALLPLLRAYAADFDDLPAPGPSRLGLRWTAQGTTQPKRIVIAFADGTPFAAIAQCAARIAGVLVESDIRWTVISNGREADVPGGVSVRLLPLREMGPEEGPVFRLEEVPLEAEAIAQKLFGAQAARASRLPEAHVGWRQRYAREVVEVPGKGVGEAAASLEQTGVNLSFGTVAPAPVRAGSSKRAWAGVGVLLAIGAAGSALALGWGGAAPEGEVQAANAAVVVAAPVPVAVKEAPREAASAAPAAAGSASGGAEGAGSAKSVKRAATGGGRPRKPVSDPRLKL
jgi:hypothetical protein